MKPSNPNPESLRRLISQLRTVAKLHHLEAASLELLADLLDGLSGEQN